MKILMLLTDAFGGRGGIAKFNRDLIDCLCCNSRIDRVIALPRHVVDAIGPLPARLDFRTAAARGKTAYFSTAISALSERPEGVICGHLNLLPLAATIANVVRVPLLLVIHGVEAWDKSRSISVRRSLRSIDAVVAVSEFTLARFLRWAKLGHSSATVIPNCVDLNTFTPGQRRSDLVQRYKLADKKVMLTMGRLSTAERYKGVDEVLEILSSLSTDVPNIYYLVVGEGDDRARLEQKARALGVADRVTFTGYVTEVEKADYYRLADVFVMPGRGEGFGIVYLESLACGVPVVASAMDASREIVTTGSDFGATVDPDDPDQIRRAIVNVLRGPRPNREKLSRFTFDRFGERWGRLISDTFANEGVMERPLRSLGG